MFAWEEIRDSIKKDIIDRKLRLGEKIYSENYYAKLFKVNRHTVRRGIEALKKENIIYSRRGLGYFLNSKKINYKIGKTVRASQNLNQDTTDIAVDIISIDKRKGYSNEIREFNLKKNDSVFYIYTISKANGIPLILTERLVPEKRFKNFDLFFRKTGSMTLSFNKYGLKKIYRKKTTVSAESANNVQSKYLKINIGDPLIHTKAINTDINNKPIEISDSYFVGSKIQLEVSKL